MSKEKYVCENCNKEFYEYKSHKRGKHNRTYGSISSFARRNKIKKQR